MWHVPIAKDGWFWGVVYELRVCTCDRCWRTFRSSKKGKRKSALQWLNRGDPGDVVPSVMVKGVWLHGMSFRDLHPETSKSNHEFCGNYIVCKEFDPTFEFDAPAQSSSGNLR